MYNNIGMRCNSIASIHRDNVLMEGYTKCQCKNDLYLISSYFLLSL